MAFAFEVAVKIGDDVQSVQTVGVSKFVSVDGQTGLRERGFGYITNPLTQETYPCERFDVTTDLAAAVRANAPFEIPIGDAGASSETLKKEISIKNSELGWEFQFRLNPVTGSTESGRFYSNALWGGASVTNTYSVNHSYAPQSTQFVLLAASIKYTHNAQVGEKTYYGFIVYPIGGGFTGNARPIFATIDSELWGQQSDPLPQTPTGGAGGFGSRDNRTDVTVNIGTKPSSFLSGILGGSGFNFYFVPSYHDLIRAAYYSLNGVNNLSDFVNNTAALFLNPATYIVSAVQIPIDKSAFGAGGLRHDIRLGGLVNFNVDCYNLSQLWGDSETFTFNFDGMYFDDFMDFEPYTKISLLLPYVGVVPLKCSECIGGSVSVKYRFEGLTGKCIAFVYTTDRNGRNTGYYQYSGDAGFSVPWVGNNGGGSQMIHSAASAAISLASGTADMSTVGDLASTAASFYGSDSRPKMQGGFGVNTGVLGADDIAIFVQRAQNAMPEHYYDIHGYQTATGGVVGDYSGYTQFAYVDLENTTATDSEKAEIESLLKGGVFL